MVDITHSSFSIDPQVVAAAITSRTRAIVPVHLYGCPVDLNPLIEIARRSQLLLVEDCAQAHGARYHEKSVGAWGQMGAFSFYPTKNLGAYGDGGTIVTDEAALAERIRRLRQYGWGPDRISDVKGINSRLDELQAAILRAKLPDLDGSNISAAVNWPICTVPAWAAGGIVLSTPLANSEAVYHLFVIRCAQREALRLFLAERGIETRVHYPTPIHLQRAYADLKVIGKGIYLKQSGHAGKSSACRYTRK